MNDQEEDLTYYFPSDWSKVSTPYLTVWKNLIEDSPRAYAHPEIKKTLQLIEEELKVR